MNYEFQISSPLNKNKLFMFTVVLTVLSVYAPQTGLEESTKDAFYDSLQTGLEESTKDAFYDSLQTVISELPDKEIVIPCGD